MATYMLRVEYRCDAYNLFYYKKTELSKYITKYRIEPHKRFGEATVIFSCKKMPINYIRYLISQQDDSHVMWQTVNEESKYDSKRKYNITIEKIKKFGHDYELKKKIKMWQNME